MLELILAGFALSHSLSFTHSRILQFWLNLEGLIALVVSDEENEDLCHIPSRKAYIIVKLKFFKL